MLEIKNLNAGLEGVKILKGISLTVKKGEIHCIMGPNGSGKSTLAKILAGYPGYDVTGGSIKYNGKDLTEMEPEARANEGLFLGYQYPVEIPGVNNAEFLRMAYNSKRIYHGGEEVDPLDFDELLSGKMQFLGMDERYRERSVNDGFSGGEKKKNEILQMAVLEPTLSILDEIDSGLDIDALKVVSEGVNKLSCKNNALILITHYQRLLQYIKPDYVHVLSKGVIVKSGDSELAAELEKSGYDRWTDNDS
ncbi:MAG: Fe-S cluster assembly ATPase SufC [Nitrospinota bacterium]